MSLFRHPIRVGAISVMGLAMIALGGAFSVPAVAATSSSAPQFVAMKNSVPATSDARTGRSTVRRCRSRWCWRRSTRLDERPAGQPSTTPAARTTSTGWPRGSSTRASRRPPPPSATVASYLRVGRPAGRDVRLAVPGARHRVEPAGVQRVPHHAEHLPRTRTASRTSPTPRPCRCQAIAGCRRARRGRADQHGARALDGHPHQHTARPARQVVGGVGRAARRPIPTEAQLFNVGGQRRQLPVRLRRRPGLQRPDAVADQLDLRRPATSARGARAPGVTVAVFELSAYQESDIATWAHQFYGPNYTPPLINVIIDGGPLNPICPAGDTCPPRLQRLRRRHRGRRRHRDATDHRARRPAR